MISSWLPVVLLQVYRWGFLETLSVVSLGSFGDEFVLSLLSSSSRTRDRPHRASFRFLRLVPFR